MMTSKFEIRGEFITLTQLMKALHWVSGGSEAHIFITQGEVLLNDEVCTIKRKKLFKGDVVEWNGEKVELV